MTNETDDITVRMIPIGQITVLNPRVRNPKVFRLILDSISKVGLKRPITVSQSSTSDGALLYDLVCGQGRLEAFISLGQQEIPAIIIDVSEEDSLIMSLVENIARRQHRPMELLREIGVLKKRGNSYAQIAEKTALSYDYVHSIGRLLEEGEERLLVAVETGKIPISVAIDIVDTDAEGVQDALALAYENGLLRGKKLLTARRVVEQRQRRGKTNRNSSPSKGRSRMSSDALVRAYQQEADRQRLMIKRAEITQDRLLFIVEAMRKLLADDNFVTLLRAESLKTMPRPLADLVIVKRG
ncbi:plasmid partitioning protein RepB C-terminal domain-containing protein [Magnetovibrio blakemorei]|uniref:Chromosome partitioning protein ParB n=1 Tax=Magnetovibrio blakemorei TaxID=28181 RepID=A0A1E5Q5G1_9PROT|nr:plasmid partitioning protein RepB C-terminal domain-containing protein [Magnetovibrio blakemorei]OEJ65494.1 chromosome partitioning protein ParB [Magnetovibrio blakemorei]